MLPRGVTTLLLVHCPVRLSPIQSNPIQVKSEWRQMRPLPTTSLNTAKLKDSALIYKLIVAIMLVTLLSRR